MIQVFRSQESGVRSQESGVRSQESGARSQESIAAERLDSEGCLRLPEAFGRLQAPKRASSCRVSAEQESGVISKPHLGAGGDACAPRADPARPDFLVVNS